jgi:hypothetical protein
MIISASAKSRLIEDTATKLHCPLPKAFAQALTEARALQPAAAELEGQVAAMNAAAVSAIRQGKDPGADPNVIRLATLVTLGNNGIRHFAADFANDAISVAIVEHADAITASWASAVDDDLAVLTAAAEKLDVPVLDAADPLLLRRAGLLNDWAGASGAAERGSVALAGMRGVLSAIAVNYDKSDLVLVLAPDADLDAYQTANSLAGPNQINPWIIARSGAPMRLATVSEFMAAIGRVNAAHSEQQRRLDEAEEQQEQKVRREGSARQWTRVR